MGYQRETWARHLSLAVLVLATFTLMATSAPPRLVLPATDTIVLAPGDTIDLLLTTNRRAVRFADTSSVEASVWTDWDAGVRDGGVPARSGVHLEMLEDTSIAPVDIRVGEFQHFWAGNWHLGCADADCTRTIRVSLDSASPVSLTVTLTAELVMASGGSAVCSGPSSFPQHAELTLAAP